MGCCASRGPTEPDDLGDPKGPPRSQDPPADTQTVEDPPARNRTANYRSRSGSITNEHDIQPKLNEGVLEEQSLSDHSPQDSVWSGSPGQASARRRRARSRTRDAPDRHPRSEAHRREIRDAPDQVSRRQRSQWDGHDQLSRSPSSKSSKAPRGKTWHDSAVPSNLLDYTGLVITQSPPETTGHMLDGLAELPDALLSTDGKPAAKIETLDCTNRLSERTDITYQVTQRPSSEAHRRSTRDTSDQVPRRPRSQSDGHDQMSRSPSSSAPRVSPWLDLAVPSDLLDYTSLFITQRVLDTRDRLDGLTELRDALLLTHGKPSAKIEALDCTTRLSERTEIKGIGAYSDVSQAKLDSRLVAVKVLRATGIEGTDGIRMRKRLGREIHAWVALRHPHILEFLGFAFEGGRPCLISPWCEHGTLSGYLKRHGGADRGSLVCQIAEGLNYLHLQSPPVVHGDLKTANVLITKDHIAKISDFGVSKHLGESKTGFTTNGIITTTLRYSAPETLLQEGGHHTLQSDVYSFACVALETMTSKCPFWKISNPAAIITKVAIKQETPSPGDYPDLNDNRLWELLHRCWSYEPRDRPKMFAVCSELATAGYRPSPNPQSGSLE